MLDKEITVVSRKYDLSIQRSWKCRLHERYGQQLLLVGEFAELVEHPDLGLIEKGTLSYEYYWLDRWYNVFRFCAPDGKLRNFYCNINTPPKFDGSTLDYIDLDIDLIVWPDGRTVTLDEVDFALNSAKYDYPPDIRQNALESQIELKRMIEAREFPFDGI